ncbi:hypothetical protein LR48_Vigan09g095800 [Vigna angularis]|uniref:4Fe-4S ferredoxin-type domain-containing protein n=2 Tax=Phaseolus angularis TaxID=3914 RepID=A0A0L9VCB4_PHAAN|nr:extensin-3 [Vigna angularis]KOM52299.1 hypothetical protein LR48_Vigan09g095800 [Vigna angularis]BAT88492.1 hypothetical protein VIGAN_05200000 [Vigna angularis var. angularis]
MFSTKFVSIVITLWVYLSKASGDDVTQFPTTCLNCSKCEEPCQEQPSPPLVYGAPPPPPPPPYGYPIYGAPPPPKEKNPNKCPPPPPADVECCTPATPDTFPPPYPYIPVPYGEGQRSSSMFLPLIMMLFSSFIFLF